ncbi:VPS10 domain-containing protein [Roseivirga sp.]|uniref:VPS10 domain-containing protein n=1 Tax=Roseivirga sp. TaxID=1964215 RepID=UPI003B8BD0B2
MKLSKYLSLFTLLFFCALSIQAQTDLSLFKTMEPRSIGPAGMSGRVTSIDVVRSNKNVIYVGTASGGLWKSVSGGVSWEPLFDDQEVASIGAVAIDPSNASTIWVGTGEGNPRNSLNGGYGVYRSLDGGETWKHMGLKDTKNIHRLIIHPNDPNTIWVGAIGSPWTEHEERGVFKSTDGGKSWRKVLYDVPGAGISDLVIDPENPNKLIAGMWEHRRYPWFFNSGGPASGIYITHDGGETWDRKTSADGLPKGDMGRIGLAIAPSKPDRVYAYVESKENALYRSDDGGNKWYRISNKGDRGLGGRPFYYADIYVDTENENRVYSIHTQATVSEDGGKSFGGFVNTGIVHVDNHALYIHPDDPNFMVLGNDGGMVMTRNRGGSWHFMENLPIGQFYHVSYDMETPYNVMGGMQDNGAWLGPSQLLKQGGIRNGFWERIVGGDGFDVVPDPLDTRYGYSLSQGANIQRYDRKTGQMVGIRPEHPDGEQIRWNWNAGVNIDPIDKKTIYLGGQYLFKSSDHGDNWEIISPDLTTNDPEKQRQMETGGLNFDNSGAEMHTTITVVSPSSLAEGMIWVGTDDGNVQLTRDGGGKWVNSAGKFPGLPANSWVQQIRPSTYDAGTAFVVFDEHRRDDWSPYVYKTTNYGRTWKRIVNDGDVFGFAMSIVQDPVEPNLFFLGTEGGLYVSMDGADTWAKWTHGFPTVPTMDLQIHPREHDLIIGTFGRALWILDDIRPLREATQMGMKKLKEKEIHTFSIPDATNAIIGPYWGYRSTGSGLFRGENKPFNAAISFYAKKAGRVKMEVADASGKVVRTRSYNAKEGVNRVYWGFEADGIRQPGSRKPSSANGNKPSGYDVLPGTYTITMTLKGESSSQPINVLRDMRTDWDDGAMQEKQAFIGQYYALINKVTAAVDQLTEANSVLAEISGLSVDNKELNKKTSEAKKKIAELRGLIFEAPVQGFRNDPSMLSRILGNVRGKMGGSFKPVTQPQTLALKNASNAAQPILDKISAFFIDDWEAYKDFVNGLNLELVKKIND